MEYKELIEELRFLSKHVPEEMCDENGKDVLEKAAETIEILLSEKDAAIKMLHGECNACKNNTGWHNVGKCEKCMHETARLYKMVGYREDNWEWRGIASTDKN